MNIPLAVFALTTAVVISVWVERRGDPWYNHLFSLCAVMIGATALGWPVAWYLAFASILLGAGIHLWRRGR